MDRSDNDELLDVLGVTVHGVEGMSDTDHRDLWAAC